MRGTKATGLARRRADLARMKRRARRVHPHDPAAKLANHLKACSCRLCGNPRRLLGEPTHAERRWRGAD